MKHAVTLSPQDIVLEKEPIKCQKIKNDGE